MNEDDEAILRVLLENIMTLRGLPLYTVGSDLMKRFDLGEKQMMVLREIEQGMGLALISTIADGFFLDRPQVSRIVDTLEDMGFVNRKRVSRKQNKRADRRKVHLEVTDKGLSFLSQYYEERHQYYKEIIGAFGLHEAKELSQHLERFNNLMSQRIESLIDQEVFGR
ncbi:MAG: MarR family winged helix-turn-helix transcriptional regulator [Candidatus Thorarchaeota archaeon]